MPGHAPMIRLGDGGSAPVLSYEVADSTRFAGRHYLEIQTDPQDFLDAGPTTQVSAARPPNVPERNADVYELMPLEDRSRQHGAMISRFSGDLATGETARAANAMKAIVPRMLLKPDAGGGPQGGGVGGADPGGRGTGAEDRTPPETMTDHNIDAVSAGVETEVVTSVRLSEPRESSVVAGASGGVNVTVSGAATIRPAGVLGATMTAWLDGAATPCFEGPASASFRFTIQNVVPGSHRVKLSYRRSPSATSVTSITRNFRVDAGTGGATIPVLTVLSPSRDSIVVDTVKTDGLEYGKTLVRCRASHVNEILSVTVAVMDPAATVSVTGATTPLTAEAADVYSGEADLFGYGPHTLLIVATAKTGERTTVEVPVILSSRAPRRYLYSRLMLVERVQLTTRLGNYGAGRIVKTFSLLPGERMTVNVKTYRRATSSEKRASTIFDGVETTTADEFTKAIDAEDNNKSVSNDSLGWEVKANVEQGWGSGHASISGGVDGSHNASLETFAKNVMNATSKHASNASAKRTMEVNAESQVQTEVGEEETITREIANINQSRTLNFVFRQMNQEFISVLHLVDVRIGYSAFYRDALTGELIVEYREATIAQLQSFLDGVLVPDAVPAARDGILETLQHVADYNDNLVSLIEKVVPKRRIPNGTGTGFTEEAVPKLGYWRVRRDLTQTWTTADAAVRSTVPGIALSGDLNVMRTDGLIVDAVLGGGEALDAFSVGLQAATVAAREAENAAAASSNASTLANNARIELGTKIITDADTARAQVWKTLAPSAVPASPLPPVPPGP